MLLGRSAHEESHKEQLIADRRGSSTQRGARTAGEGTGPTVGAIEQAEGVAPKEHRVPAQGYARGGGTPRRDPGLNNGSREGHSAVNSAAPR